MLTIVLCLRISIEELGRELLLLAIRVRVEIFFSLESVTVLDSSLIGVIEIEGTLAL